MLTLILLIAGVGLYVLWTKGDIELFKVFLFVPAIGFVLWAVLTERSDWEGDEERMARRRARRRFRFRRRPTRPADDAAAQHTPAPVRRTRDRGPEGRRRRLRRHMRNPLAVTAFLVCVALIVLAALLRGCSAWPLIG